MPVRRTGAGIVALLAAGALLGGCAPAAVPGTARPALVPTVDRALVEGYVADSNRAADGGPEVQTDFLRRTQDPSAPFPPPRCFGELTLETRIVARTLRPDPGWRPPATSAQARPPEGAIYVAAASVTARRGTVQVREDVGSKHFAVREGRVFGYAPCAR